MINEVKIVSDPISSHIWFSLHNYALDEALFAAERLFAEAKNEESLFLVATCLYRMNAPKQVIKLLNLNTFSSPKTRYLLAKCYYDCNMLNDAENSLLGPDCSKPLSEALLVYGEQACYAFLLLGNVHRYKNDFKKAQLCYKECLKLNPMMWSAFHNLCSISEFVDPDEVFKLSPSHGILTPTFTVVGESVASAKSAVNIGVKTALDKLGSRENVNPNSPVNEVSDLKSENDPENLNAPATVAAQIVKSTYVAPCTVSNQDISEDLPVNFTPVGFPVSSITPSSPIMLKEEAKPKKIALTESSSVSNELPPPGGSATAVLPSPMFACLPVFSRSDFNSTPLLMASESVQPVRLALTQSTSNRRPTNRQTPMMTSGQLQAAILFNPPESNPTGPASQWRAKEANISTPSQPGFIVPTFGRNGGVSPLPAWTLNPSAASILVSTSSTPATAVATPAPPKPGLLFDDTGNTTMAGLQPMDTTETSESSHQQIENSPETSAVGPRTRAQKARAAACRKSPRLSRAHKTSLDDSKDSGDSRKSFGRIVNTSRVGKDDLFEYSRVLCTASDDRNDPRSDAISAYLHLLRLLGHAYSQLAQHNYKGAVALLSELPFEHLTTGQVLTWAARAHVDAAGYSKARKIFSELRKLEPWNLCGMDIYSTVLWYQGAEQELSQLASDVLALDRTSSIPWSVAGNYYALIREHDTSIRFLRRAMQVCPTDSYACTLLGHEYVAVENLDRAASAFRHALRLNERNYSARFGLSNVYFKQDYFGLADAHLVRALSIFPNSCLLLTHLGAIRARIGRLEGDEGSAISLLNKAVEIDPTNPMALYHRACILTQLGRFQESIDELERLMVITPHEAMIYFMLGNAYQKIGNHPQSMIYFSWAMELDPKGVNSSLRDIMASGPSGLGGPGGPRVAPLAPFVCAAAATLVDHPPAPSYASPVDAAPQATPSSTSTRTTGRRGGGGVSAAPRARRSARGRPTATAAFGRGNGTYRLFHSEATSTATTPNNSVAGVDLTIEEQAGGPNSLFRTSWSAQPSGGGGGRDSMEGGLEDVEEELSIEEDDEETMDLGDE
nr:cell division cycle protein 27 [Hymenolepis microstoma]CDS35120.1 cell division cycle protein 27 [Hymenolepis microstoma]